MTPFPLPLEGETKEPEMTEHDPSAMTVPSTEREPLTDEELALMEQLRAPHQTYVRDLLDEVYRLRAESADWRKSARFEESRADGLANAYEQTRAERETARAQVGVLQGQLDKARALHQPKTICTEWHEFPVEPGKRTICERCTGGDPDDYYTQMVPWPCENARALGLDEGDGQ